MATELPSAPIERELREIVGLAVRAPSLHNSQPWRFQVGQGCIDVLADPTRTLLIADPDGWAVRLACGAAAFNIRLGYHRLGWEPAVSLLPEPGNPALLARVRPHRRRPAAPVERALVEAVPRRHSNRHPFLDTAIPVPHLVALPQAAMAEGAWLTVLDDPGRVSDVAALVRHSERDLAQREGYQEELRSWGRPDQDSTDGVPFVRTGPPPLDGEMLPRRDFGTTAEPSRRAYESDPVLAVLGTHGGGHTDDIGAGQALQRVLLTLTTQGLVASMFSQPVEVPAARARLATICGRRGIPQMVLRIGFGVPSTSPPRRPLDEVIVPPTDLEET